MLSSALTNQNRMVLGSAASSPVRPVALLEEGSRDEGLDFDSGRGLCGDWGLVSEALSRGPEGPPAGRWSQSMLSRGAWGEVPGSALPV